MESSATYSLEECINHIGLGKFQWRLIAILGFCSMADAVEMMLLAILGPTLTCYWPEVTQVQIAFLTTVGEQVSLNPISLTFDETGRLCRYDVRRSSIRYDRR
jgi:hypothetical protein